MAKRCFFSFHYQDVIDFRANVVRNHNVTKDDNGGFFDASIWESAKRSGEASLKRLINDGLNNTSVTVVLIGAETYARRWVKYEIFKSLECGNDLLGIHINSIKDRYGNAKVPGPNPLEYLAIHVSADSRTGTPMEWGNEGWVSNRDMAPFSILEQPFERRNRVWQLKTWFRTYDWIADNGFHNFSNWVA